MNWKDWLIEYVNLFYTFRNLYKDSKNTEEIEKKIEKHREIGEATFINIDMNKTTKIMLKLSKERKTEEETTKTLLQGEI